MTADSELYHQAASCYADGHAESALARLQPLLEREHADHEVLNLAAICAYRLNRADEAEAFWRRAIEEHPEEAGPLNNLANLLIAQDRLADAQAAYLSALELRPEFAQAHYNLANVRDRLGRFDEAEQGFRRALALQPDLAEAHYNLGALLARRARPAEAEAAYRRAIEVRPDYPDAHNNLGNLLTERFERHDEAAEHLRIAAALRPDWADAHFNLGHALRAAGHAGDAESSYGRALALDPAHAGALDSLADLLHQLGRYDEAEARARASLLLAPADADKHVKLGHILYRATIFGHGRRFDAAEDHFRQALALQPDATAARDNLGLLLKEQPARFSEAEALFRESGRVDPDSKIWKINLATHCLATGRYAEGWALMETRYDSEPDSIPLRASDWPIPRWQGESLHDKTLFVLAEQGFGDNLHFCRYLPMLKQRGVAKLIMVCPPALQSMLSTVGGVDLCITPAELEMPPRADFWTLLLSLPFLFGTTLATIPAPVPYLRVDDDRIAAWRARLPSREPKIGIVWSGVAAKWPIESSTSLSRRWLDAHQLTPLLATPDVTFVSLQKGDAARAQLATLPDTLRPLDLMDDAHDFADTAAIIASLDLVITVDTSVAHLAGALGKPVWIMLCSGACWRWLLDRDDSPWYPSARLFRQTEPGEWRAVVARVADALSQRLTAPHSP